MAHVAGHGGGGGGHGVHHGGGFPGVFYDPWTFYDLNDGQECKESHKRHVVGSLSTGTGGLLVLLVVGWLVLEADKRVPR